jgi:hypothetical protein
MYKTGLTVMITPDLSIRSVAGPMFCGSDKFLGECECELLLVDIDVSDDGSNDLAFAWQRRNRRKKERREEKHGNQYMNLD